MISHPNYYLLNFNVTLKPIKFHSDYNIRYATFIFILIPYVNSIKLIIIHDDIAYDDTIKKYPYSIYCI